MGNVFKKYSWDSATSVCLFQVEGHRATSIKLVQPWVDDVNTNLLVILMRSDFCMQSIDELEALALVEVHQERFFLDAVDSSLHHHLVFVYLEACLGEAECLDKGLYRCFTSVKSIHFL